MAHECTGPQAQDIRCGYVASLTHAGKPTGPNPAAPLQNILVYRKVTVFNHAIMPTRQPHTNHAVMPSAC